jgi:hypothetical protein
MPCGDRLGWVRPEDVDWGKTISQDLVLPLLGVAIGRMRRMRGVAEAASAIDRSSLCQNVAVKLLSRA